MIVQKRTTIPLNGVVDNVLVGDQYEFAPWRSIVEFGLVAVATGLEADVLVGANSVVTRLPITVQRAANQFAVYPDEFIVRAGALMGQRVIVRIRNTTGGNIDAFTTVRYNPR